MLVGSDCNNKMLGHATGAKKGADSKSIRLAYLHNLGDVYVSLAPVVAGLLVTLLGQSLFDPLMALLVAVWLIGTTVQEIRSIGEALLWPEDAVCRHEPLPSMVNY
jgi:cobalt-zinc-cadmium efflux system protein